jgi:hypothetical protein
MEQRNIHFPEKNIDDISVTASSTVTPDLNVANIFRITATANVVIANPTNIRDGQFIHIEVVSSANKTVTFGNKYLYNGAAMTDTNDMEDIIIYEGYYSSTRDKIDIMAVAGSQLSADLYTYLVDDSGYHTTNDAQTAEVVLNS